MLTQATMTSIALLQDIALNCEECRENSPFEGKEPLELLNKLMDGGLIRLLPQRECGSIYSYELGQPLHRISLLKLLETTDEHLNCNHPTREEFYSRFGKAAQRLGVVNHMTRLYLNEISLAELSNCSQLINTICH